MCLEKRWPHLARKRVFEGSFYCNKIDAVFCEGQDSRSCEVQGTKKALIGIRAADNKTFLVDVPGAFELHFTLI